MRQKILLSNILLSVVVPVCVIAQTPSAENWSYATSCAEEDNINVPIFYEKIDSFEVIASHPTYEVGNDNCAPDFSGCDTTLSLKRLSLTSCGNPIWDDGVNVVLVCEESEWWRGSDMEVTVGSMSKTGHRVVIHKKIAGVNSWPEFLVFYQDGNMRLIPHPPAGRSNVCFGSSVIIGPATPDSSRPAIDVQKIVIDPSTMSLDITYQNGDNARLFFSVNRETAKIKVIVNYDKSKPFATFRSMCVIEGNADVDKIENGNGSFPLCGDWTTLEGWEWFFWRMTRSIHNTSAPDIRIRILTNPSSVDENIIVPSDFSLLQNYPNPFNPTTKIIYHLPKPSRIVLRVFDLNGEEIRTLIDEYQSAGIKSVEWDGTNNIGKTVPSGLYVYTLKLRNVTQSKKMLFIK